MNAIQINDREKRILLLAAVVAVVFLITQVFPMISGIYQQRQESIDRVLLDVQREQRLIENSELWQQRSETVLARQAELEQQVFIAATAPLIEAAIQRDLTAYARDAGIGVTSTRLAEQIQTEGWQLVSQEMAFRTDDAANSVAFLEQLEQSRPRLFVTEFSLDRTRNQYTGSITVVGFARVGEAVNNETGESP
jgi:hypothetical protein